MKRLLILTLSLILTLYIASTIIFAQNYPQITYLINILLLANFIFLVLIEKSSKFLVNNVIVFYSIFATIALASSFWAFDFSLSSFIGLRLFYIVINLLVIYNILKKHHLKNAFLNGILLGSFVNYIFVFHLVEAPFEITMPDLRVFGTLGNPNVLAITMMFSIFASIIYLGNKEGSAKPFFYYQYVNVLLSVYLIFLTASKKGIIFGGILIFFYLMLSLRNFKNLLRLGVLGAAAIWIAVSYIDIGELLMHAERFVSRFEFFYYSLQGIGGYDYSTEERQNFIELGLQLLGDRPLFGYGIDNFRIFGGTYSHNNFIELLVGVGIIGAIAYYSMYAGLIVKVLKMDGGELKVLLAIFVFIIFAMDIAVVSYIDKLTIYMLLLVSLIAEEKCVKIRREVNDV
ncbi:MAG: hypothetical protein QG567_424 [Campylobacterota bacterium]|nr:hypothetical protein [Campylobacterota bacterium]